MRIFKIALAGAALTGALLTSCNSKTDKEYSDEGWKYRDSVYDKNQKVFFDNGYHLDSPPESPKQFYWKWKNLNDSLNEVQRLKSLKATEIYGAAKPLIK